MKPRTLRDIIWKSTTGSQVPAGSWLRAITIGSTGEPVRHARAPGDLAHAPALGRCHQVVAAAEARAVARQRDHVHLGVEVRPLDAGRELARHLEGDAVAALGPVEGDARDAAVALVGHRSRARPWRRKLSRSRRRARGARVEPGPGHLPATERTGEVTKLHDRRVLRGGRRRDHARAARAADHARALAEGRPRGHDHLDARGPQGRRLLPEANPEGGARLGRDGADRVPVGPQRRRGLPDRARGPSSGAAHMGTITFNPWPVRRDDVDHPDELRVDLDPQPGTDFADAVEVAGRGARGCSTTSASRASRRPRAARGIHVYVRIEPRWTFTEVRHAAIALGARARAPDAERVTTKWWKEERGERIFVDYNQNARDRTIASPYSVRPEAWRPGLGSARVGRAARRPARGLHRRLDAGALRRRRRPLRRDRRHPPLAGAAAGDVRARRGRGRRRHAVPARLPEDAGRAEARAAEQGEEAEPRTGEPSRCPGTGRAGRRCSPSASCRRASAGSSSRGGCGRRRRGRR